MLVDACDFTAEPASVTAKVERKGQPCGTCPKAPLNQPLSKTGTSQRSWASIVTMNVHFAGAIAVAVLFGFVAGATAVRWLRGRS